MWHDNNIQSNVHHRKTLITQLNHLASLAKWLSVPLQTKWLQVRIPLLSTSDIVPGSSKEFLEVQETIECKFTLKCVCDMITKYSQKHYTDEYSQHSSMIWPIWLNSWVFVYKLSGYGLKSRCYHLNFRYNACFEQGVPRHWGNYRV